jgi:hypothetical protein
MSAFTVCSRGLQRRLEDQICLLADRHRRLMSARPSPSTYSRRIRCFDELRLLAQCVNAGLRQRQGLENFG